MRQLMLGVTLLFATVLSGTCSLANRRRLLIILLVAATVTAAAGYLSQHIYPQGKTLWWTTPVLHGKPVGCFINRNHFGGFIALFAPIVLLMGIHTLSKKQFFRAALCVLAVCVMTWAIIFSQSRGAWVAFASGLLLVVAYEFRRSHIAIPLSVLGIVTCVVAGIMITHLDPDLLEETRERAGTMQDIGTTASAQSRLTTWQDALTLTRDYPLLGAGPDAFRMVFPQNRSNTFRKSFRHAENEYVQGATEYGLVGLVLVILLMVILIKHARDKAHLETPAAELLRYCALAGIGVAATHAMLDFTLHIPVYALVVAILAGFLIPAPPPESTTPIDPNVRRFDLVFIMCGILVIAHISLQGTKVYRYDNAEAITQLSLPKLEEALIWAPTSWQIWHHLGKRAMEDTQHDIRFANRCTTQALAYNPNHYRLWILALTMRDNQGDYAGAVEARGQAVRLRPWLNRSLPVPQRRTDR
jgi:O-antigen ligase